MMTNFSHRCNIVCFVLWITASLSVYSLPASSMEPAAGSDILPMPNKPRLLQDPPWKRPLWQVHTVYGLYSTGGDLGNRFGTSSMVGLELQRQTPRLGWIWSLRGGHLFGA
ncbi:MAG: hypothetical protein ACKOFE_10390, partial [Bacteroidota bacterium]